MKGVRCILYAFTQHDVQIILHFNTSAKGHVRIHTVGRGCQPGQAHLLKIVPSPVLSHEPYPPLASQNNVIVLIELILLLATEQFCDAGAILKPLSLSKPFSSKFHTTCIRQ